MMLIAVPMLPMPETSSDSVQKSVLCPARKCLRGQRRVGKPPDVGSVAGAVESVATDKTEIEEKPAEGRHPEAESIQARKRHIARADHQGNQIIRKSKYERHGDEENHGRPMHGEHPVEDLGGDEIVQRTDELDPHDRRLNSPDYQKQQRIKDVQEAEAFVIDGRDPLVKLFHKTGAAPRPFREVRWIGSTSAKGLQILGYCIEFRVAQTHGGHFGSRLDGVGILNPAPQICRCVRGRAGSNRVAAH